MIIVVLIIVVYCVETRDEKEAVANVTGVSALRIEAGRQGTGVVLDGLALSLAFMKVWGSSLDVMQSKCRHQTPFKEIRGYEIWIFSRAILWRPSKAPTQELRT